jgi:hypothetical protein
VQCFGDEITFIETLSCNGNIFVTYERPACFGVRVAWSFGCADNGFGGFSFYRDTLSVSSVNSEVCDPDSPRPQDCIISEIIRTDSILNFGENHTIGGTRIESAASVGSINCEGPSDQLFTIRVDPLPL